MTTTGPFSSTELTAMKVLAELHKDTDPRAMDMLRVLRMLDARDLVIRQLNEASDAWQARSIAAEGNLQSYVYKLAESQRKLDTSLESEKLACMMFNRCAGLLQTASDALRWYANNGDLSPDLGLEARKALDTIRASKPITERDGPLLDDHRTRPVRMGTQAGGRTWGRSLGCRKR